MKKYHIAFFPRPAHAHINATLAIASELAKRNHYVSYATTEYFAPKISQTGAETITYHPVELTTWEAPNGGKRLAPEDPKAWEWFLANMPQFYTVNAVRILSQITPFYESNKPDLIIYDSTEYTGRILASMWGIPAIQICPHLAFYNEFFSKTKGAWCKPLPTDELCKKMDNFFRIFFPIEQKNIFFIPRSFQQHGDSFDDRFFFPGPCIPPKNHKNYLDKKPNDQPLILVSTTTAIEVDSEYFKIFVHALSESKFRVVLSIGDQIDPISIGSLPPNFEINQYKSHHEILPEASLFIGGGGISSTMESLYYGVPMILIPLSIFHLDAAYRAAQLGLALVLEKSNLTVETLKNAIINATEDPNMKNSVRNMQKNIINAGGTAIVIEEIEKNLKSINSNS